MDGGPEYIRSLVCFHHRPTMRRLTATPLERLRQVGVDMRCMTTPVTTINGEVVVGFDQKRLEALLG